MATMFVERHNFFPTKIDFLTSFNWNHRASANLHIETKEMRQFKDELVLELSFELKPLVRIWNAIRKGTVTI